MIMLVLFLIGSFILNLALLGVLYVHYMDSKYRIDCLTKVLKVIDDNSPLPGGQQMAGAIAILGTMLRQEER